MLKSYSKILSAIFVIIISVYTGVNIDTTKESKSKNSSLQYKEVTQSTKNILALSWHNNFCKTHSYKKECKNRNNPAYKSKFVLHGLWPQPRNNVNCNNTKLTISNSLLNELKIYMPGVASNLHKHEWKKHGSCYSKNADVYFQDSIRLTSEFQALFSNFFRQKVGHILTKEAIVREFNKLLFIGAGKKIQLICKNGNIEEIRLNLQNKISHTSSLRILLKNAKNLFGGCQKGFLN